MSKEAIEVLPKRVVVWFDEINFEKKTKGILIKGFSLKDKLKLCLGILIERKVVMQNVDYRIMGAVRND